LAAGLESAARLAASRLQVAGAPAGGNGSPLRDMAAIDLMRGVQQAAGAAAEEFRASWRAQSSGALQAHHVAHLPPRLAPGAAEVLHQWADRIGSIHHHGLPPQTWPAAGSLARRASEALRDLAERIGSDAPRAAAPWLSQAAGARPLRASEVLRLWSESMSRQEEGPFGTQGSAHGAVPQSPVVPHPAVPPQSPDIRATARPAVSEQEPPASARWTTVPALVADGNVALGLPAGATWFHVLGMESQPFDADLMKVQLEAGLADLDETTASGLLQMTQTVTVQCLEKLERLLIQFPPEHESHLAVSATLRHAQDSYFRQLADAQAAIGRFHEQLDLRRAEILKSIGLSAAADWRTNLRMPAAANGAASFDAWWADAAAALGRAGGLTPKNILLVEQRLNQYLREAQTAVDDLTSRAEQGMSAAEQQFIKKFIDRQWSMCRDEIASMRHQVDSLWKRLSDPEQRQEALRWMKASGSRPYEVLGLGGPPWSEGEINKAYKKLALKVHPDRIQHPDPIQQEAEKAIATRAMAMLTEAREILLDYVKSARP
jgi:hypothetical protein